MTYFNTTDVKSPQLELFVDKAKSQDAVVLEFMKSQAPLAYTPLAIHQALNKLNLISELVPYTSIRRSVSTLRKKGFLINTNERLKEKFGRDNYLYQFNQNKTK